MPSKVPSNRQREDELDQNERNRLVALRAALVGTTNTPGWGYIKGIAKNIVEKTTSQALDEEDKEKRDAKVLKASALKKGFAELFSVVEITKGFDPEAPDDGGFGELEEA